MHKLVRKLIAACMIVSMLLALSACANTERSTLMNETNSKYGRIWSAPSTVKIEQYDTEYEEKGKAALYIQAVRNEYESVQLLITADKDIQKFELKKTNLSGEKGSVAAENFEVYMQKYVPYNDSNGKGSMPDALIPMASADEYNENQIGAGENGGLWVTAYVPKETEAGVYSGNFTLVLDGEDGKEEIDVPVSLEVVDYTLTDDVTASTLFSWRYSRVAPGELDGSIEMMTYYYEFFKDYRISLQSLPVDGLTGEEFVKNVKKYYDDITTYCILASAGDISGSLDDSKDIVIEQILAVAAESTSDKNYFEKAMLYFLDEPDLSNRDVRNVCKFRIEKMNTILQECVELIKEDTTGTYDEFKKIQDWEKVIIDIPSVIPVLMESIDWMIENEETQEGQEMIQALNCLCPLFEVFSDQAVAKVQDFCGRNDILLWWYGCVGPTNPYPTYHIGDENLLSARTVSWLQKKYDIAGNLYWDAAAYTDENLEYLNEYINVYEEPVRITKSALPAGDGFLTYPGAPYGIYGPVPSLRLMSIRDGMEEYEILNDIEKQLESYSTEFGERFDVAKAMDVFYKPIAYEGIKMYKDGENGLDFTKVRSQLLNLASGISKGIGFAMGDVSINGTEATFDYYIQNGSTVTVNGQEQTPVSGQRYEYALNLEENTSVELVVTNAGGESAVYTQFIGLPIYILSALSDATDMEAITVSDGSDVVYEENTENSTDGSAFFFEINGVVTGNPLMDNTFVPSVKISKDLFADIKIADTATISFDVYNPGEDFTMKIRLYSGSNFADYGDFEVKNGKNTLTLDIRNQSFSDMDSVDTISLEFENKAEETAAKYEFYLDNMTYDR